MKLTRLPKLLHRALIAAALSVVASGFTAAGAGAARPTPAFLVNPIAPYQAGDQVWTVDQGVPGTPTMLPFVAPDPVALQVILTPADRPYRPGDKVWTSSNQVPPPAQPDANGCLRVPATGYIGTNVFGSTSYEYSNYWYWSGGTSSEPFHWYIRRLSDDQALYDGHSSGGGGSQNTNANNWRWQVQNQGSDPQAWNACYEVL